MAENWGTQVVSQLISTLEEIDVAGVAQAMEKAHLLQGEAVEELKGEIQMSISIDKRPSPQLSALG